MIKQTDIALSSKPEIYVSRQLMYGKTKRLNSVKIAKALIEETLPIFSKLLNVPKDLTFRLTRFKANHSGRYNDSSHVVSIDPNYQWDRLLETLAHELVHAEQYHEGRLESLFVPRNGWMYQWNGELNKNKGTTYSSYRKQPWEQEAFGRQKSLADQVCKILDKSR